MLPVRVARHVHFHCRPPPRSRMFNYRPAVAFMVSMGSLLLGAFHFLYKGAAGRISVDPLDTVLKTIFIISLMISFPAFVWAMTLPRNSADVFARMGVVSGSTAVASVLSMFLPNGCKWLAYLICFVACLPSFFPNLLKFGYRKKVLEKPAPAPLVQQAEVVVDMEAGPPDTGP